MKGDITAPISDNQTGNTCPDCLKHWLDKKPVPGLLHRTKLCNKCKRKKYVKH